MEHFKKITEDLYYDEEGNVDKYLCEKVSTILLGNKADDDMRLDEALIGCESPIEQLLALELEWIRLKEIYSFNPFVDVIDIEKQKEIVCGDKKYRVDFFIPVLYKNQEGISFIVECDGHEFHQKTKEQVEKDNTRMRDLQKAGYEIIRFSGTEIWHRPYKCALEVRNIILSKCKYTKEE